MLARESFPSDFIFSKKSKNHRKTKHRSRCEHKDSMIEIKHLTKIYPSKSGDTVALNDIDLTIPDGAIFGVIGLSGAGKSTLVRCINMLEKPTAGSVVIDGEDITAVKAKRLNLLRKNIGMIFQNFNLLEQRTVAQNVRFPLDIAPRYSKRSQKDSPVPFRVDKARREERVKELLELVELSDKANSYPSQLSGGQKQRVAIARALALRPKYLLCDEATSALDPTTTKSILALLKDINEKLGVTVIVITHEMKVVESICTDVAVISNSKIAETGKVAEVFSSPQSDITKELIIPDLIRAIESEGGKKLRLIFAGDEADAPVISGLALECGVKANILYADTKNIDGKSFGHMVIAVSEEDGQLEAAKAYLLRHNVRFEEEL